MGSDWDGVHLIVSLDSSLVAFRFYRARHEPTAGSSLVDDHTDVTRLLRFVSLSTRDASQGLAVEFFSERRPSSEVTRNRYEQTVSRSH